MDFAAPLPYSHLQSGILPSRAALCIAVLWPYPTRASRSFQRKGGACSTNHACTSSVDMLACGKRAVVDAIPHGSCSATSGAMAEAGAGLTRGGVWTGPSRTTGENLSKKERVGSASVVREDGTTASVRHELGGAGASIAAADPCGGMFSSSSSAIPRPWGCSLNAIMICSKALW